MKFVGLPVSRDQLKSATCPTSVQEAMKSVAEDERDGPKSELEGLLISAAPIASTSSSKLASSGESDLHATVDLSSATQKTHDTSMSAEVGNKSDQDSCANSVQNDHSSSSSKDSGQKASIEKSVQQLSSSSSVVSFSAATQLTSSNTSSNDDASPLVDLSAPGVSSIMAELKLGDSVPTSDTAEFLSSWTSFDNSSVSRAQLWHYNPVNGEWSAQTTLAHLGPMLKTDRKGSFRDAFFVSFLHQDEPLGRYVGKRYRRQREPKVYTKDVVCQMEAVLYVTLFNQALQKCTDDILKIQYLTAAHLKLLNADGKVVDWINVEPFLQGSFLKLTNNLRYVSPDLDNEKGVEVATALSHFSYVKSGGDLMVVDLQGWLPTDKKGVVYLTDPVFNTRYIEKYSTSDQREAGMQAFWKHVHPKCNKICRFLQLDKLRPDNETATS
ncbi:alpha-protein kinase 1-like [Pomacea canaliculata]|nr:alpha-protein kinase 1-like [Pomacea canaliculata]